MRCHCRARSACWQHIGLLQWLSANGQHRSSAASAHLPPNCCDGSQLTPRPMAAAHAAG